MNITEGTILRFTPQTLEAVISTTPGKLTTDAKIARLKELEREFRRVDALKLEFGVDAAVKAVKAQPEQLKRDISQGGSIAGTDVWRRDEIVLEHQAKRRAAKQRLKEITGEAWEIAEPILRKIEETATAEAKRWQNTEAEQHARYNLDYKSPSLLVRTLHQIGERLVSTRKPTGFPSAPSTILAGIINL